jgi:prepilin-type N-terminal cleavage/methylation domain-containing protein
MSMHRAKESRKAEHGMTLLELLFALTIMLIGMGAVMIMISTAIAQNNGSKHDSSATMIAQLVAEQIGAQPANTNPVLNIIDCGGLVSNVATGNLAGPPNGVGATLIAAGQPRAGDINWAAQNFGDAALFTYSMRYFSCGTGGRQIQYEVRWNIQQLTVNTKLITVSARRRDQGRNGIGFNVPVTIRTITGL